MTCLGRVSAVFCPPALRLLISSVPRPDEVKLVWGEGCHSSRHGGAIFPETLRWLWAEEEEALGAGLAPWMDEAGGNSTAAARVPAVASRDDPYNKGFDGQASRGRRAVAPDRSKL